jgi:hypothetical protein
MNGLDSMLFDSNLTEDVWRMCMGTASKTFIYGSSDVADRTCFMWRHHVANHNNSMVQVQNIHYSQ